jgi:hypothetical protein
VVGCDEGDSGDHGGQACTAEAAHRRAARERLCGDGSVCVCVCVLYCDPGCHVAVSVYLTEVALRRRLRFEVWKRDEAGRQLHADVDSLVLFFTQSLAG